MEKIRTTSIGSIERERIQRALRSTSMADETLLYREEFYVLWYTGIKQDVYRDQSVVVCSVNIDEGNTTLLQIFNAGAKDVQRAEDQLLEWITDDPYIHSSDKIDVEIIMNYSPLYAFSKAFAELKETLVEQGKEVLIEIKMVRMYQVDGADEDAEENREGLKLLKQVGIHMNSVGGKDWQYLREVLREVKGLQEQDQNTRETRRYMKSILKERIAVGTQTNLVDEKEKETEKESDSSSEGES